MKISESPIDPLRHAFDLDTSYPLRKGHAPTHREVNIYTVYIYMQYIGVF